MEQQHQAKSHLAAVPRLAETSPIVLVGHGTRDPAGQAEMLSTAALVGRRFPRHRLEAGFLELAQPTIREAIARLIVPTDARVRRSDLLGALVVSPLLLFSAGHAQRDIPEAVELAARHFGYAGKIRQAEHLGCHVDVLRLSELRFQQAVAGSQEVDPQQTLLVLVGRGSRDQQATAEMHEFARCRVAKAPVGKWLVCFVAMAEPRFESTLEQVSEQLRWGPLDKIRRVVVQPHLMFRGELLDRIRQRVKSLASGKPRDDAVILGDEPDTTVEKILSPVHAVDRRGVEWIVTSHLGCHQLLANAIADRIQSCGAAD